MAENYFGITDTGKQRSNNEDTFIAEPTANNRYIIAAVIDGVGGYEGGEVAAAIARDTIKQQINQNVQDVEGGIITAFQKANDEIFSGRLKNKKHDSMACVCTLAIVDLEQNLFYYAHVGDTRIYLFRDGSLVKISNDHSFVGFLEDSGRITEDAAMKHPKRNEINKALGFEADIRNQQNYIETGSSPFLPGDMLLLCSDGLTDMVNKEEITSILSAGSRLKDHGQQLIDLANHNGGHDNVTVVLVKNDKKSVAVDAIKPSDQKKKPEQPVETVAPAPYEQLKTVGRPSGQGHKSFTTGLAIALLVVLVAAIVIYQYRKRMHEEQAVTTVKQVSDTTVIKPKPRGPSPDQQKLAQLLGSLQGDTLKLPDTTFKSPVLISSTIPVTKDTLYIKGSGNIVLKADSTFTGPAFSASSSTKLFVLDHVNFDGFKTAVSAYNNSLVIKGVKFNNCSVPVQVSLTAAQNTSVSGWLPPVIFKSDSSVKAVKKK